MEITKEHINAIDGRNVLSVSFREPVSIKAAHGIVRLGFRNAGTPKGITQALWFGDSEPKENREWFSRHFHIAFLRDITLNEKKALTKCFQEIGEEKGIGSPAVIERWGIHKPVATNYLLLHGLPLFRKV